MCASEFVHSKPMPRPSTGLARRPNYLATKRESNLLPESPKVRQLSGFVFLFSKRESDLAYHPHVLFSRREFLLGNAAASGPGCGLLI